jgi:hypothetical protein
MEHRFEEQLLLRMEHIFEEQVLLRMEHLFEEQAAILRMEHLFEEQESRRVTSSEKRLRRISNKVC